MSEKEKNINPIVMSQNKNPDVRVAEMKCDELAILMERMEVKEHLNDINKYFLDGKGIIDSDQYCLPIQKNEENIVGSVVKMSLHLSWPLFYGERVTEVGRWVEENKVSPSHVTMEGYDDLSVLLKSSNNVDELVIQHVEKHIGVRNLDANVIIPLSSGQSIAEKIKILEANLAEVCKELTWKDNPPKKIMKIQKDKILKALNDGTLKLENVPKEVDFSVKEIERLPQNIQETIAVRKEKIRDIVIRLGGRGPKVENTIIEMIREEKKKTGKTGILGIFGKRI